MKKIIATVFLYLNAYFIYAQLEENILAPSIHVGFNYSAPQRYSDTTSTFSNVTEEISFRIALLKKINSENNNFFALLLHGDESYSQPHFSEFIAQPQFIKVGTSLSTVFHYKKKNTFLLTGRVALAEDQNTINNSAYKYTGSLVYLRRASDKFTLILGAVSAYNYSITRFIPIIGMQIRPSQKTALNIIFPLSFKFQVRPVKHLEFAFSISPKNEQSRMSSIGLDSTTNPSYFKIRHLDASLQMKFIANKHLDIGLQGGVMVGNKLFLRTETQTTKISLERGAFVKLSVNYHFRERKKTEAITSTDENTTESNSEENDDLFDQLTIDDIANY